MSDRVEIERIWTQLYNSNYQDVLKECGYKFHHAASSFGYVSRRLDMPLTATFYEGKFGVGVKVFFPRYDTKRFCRVEYWLLEENLKC